LKEKLISIDLIIKYMRSTNFKDHFVIMR